MTAASQQGSLDVLLALGPIVIDRPLALSEFLELAEQLPDLRMDRDINGKTTIIPPIKKGSGSQEAEALGQLFKWYYDTEIGEVYSPSTGILLPDGQMRCPDCAWVSDERIEARLDNTDDEWLKIVPNFVIEIKSHSDTINQLQLKMEETWMANGVELGFLLDVGYAVKNRGYADHILE